MNDATMNAAMNLSQTGEVKSSEELAQFQPSVGDQLAAQRKVRAWTVEQVASQLNLAPRQIQALEEDNYAALPGMASVRGFIRAYAKLLKMDADPLIAMISSKAAPSNDAMQMQQAQPLSAAITDKSGIALQVRSWSLIKPDIGILAAALLLAAVFTGYKTEWMEEAPVNEIATVEKSTQAAESTQAGTNIVIQTDPATSAIPTTPPITPGSTGSTGTTIPDGEPLSEQKPVNSEESTALSKDALVLTVKEDSWIEIRRAGLQAKSVIFSRLVKAGSTETVEITEPVTMVIGNAAGVDATLRGEPISLKTNAKSNVARLNLK